MKKQIIFSSRCRVFEDFAYFRNLLVIYFKVVRLGYTLTYNKNEK